MKKIVLLTLAFCLIACFGACTKRGKLLGNAMILQIEPAEYIVLDVGSTQDLKALIKDARMKDVDEPVEWSVSQNESGEDLGSFSSKTSKETTFMAEASGDGTITLFCQGMTVTVNVTVN